MRRLFSFAAMAVFFIAALGVNQSLLGSENSACTTNDQLIEFSDSELSNVLPCDLLGAAYLMGLGFDAPKGFESQLQSSEGFSEFGYYFLVRLYLNQKDNESSHWEPGIFSQLLVAAISSPELYSKDQVNRWNYYSTFVLAQFWEANLESIDEHRSLLSNAMGSLMRGGEFSNTKQLGCFVRYDMPTLMIDEIVSSKPFLNCVENK